MTVGPGCSLFIQFPILPTGECQSRAQLCLYGFKTYLTEMGMKPVYTVSEPILEYVL